MRTGIFSSLTMGLAVLGTVPAVAQPKPFDRAMISLDVLHAQVILDHLGFPPGVLDGREGQSLTAALRGFQQSRGLTVTGKMDPATLRMLNPYRAVRPIRTVVLSDAMLGGPFVTPLPKDLGEQAKLPGVYYRSALEKLAEMFHTTPQVLVAMNSRSTPLRAGARIAVPGVVPGSMDYPAALDATWRTTLNDLNVGADQPKAKRVVVDKSDGVLRVYDADDRLVAQFNATMGSSKDPLPIGNWTIRGTAYNPVFHYNPALFWDADASDDKAKVPPGPNGPVGVVWIDLSKPHYGIHGTPEPQMIGRTESHGCIRLANWDAARLAMMVSSGTPAVFRE